MGESGKFTLSIAISTLPFVESCVCFAQVWLANAMGLKLLSETQRLPLLGNDVAFPDLLLSLPALGSQLLLELQCVPEVGVADNRPQAWSHSMAFAAPLRAAGRRWAKGERGGIKLCIKTMQGRVTREFMWVGGD